MDGFSTIIDRVLAIGLAVLAFAFVLAVLGGAA